ncbi:MAG: NAD(P)(+) transhydrogenase (Re/Si-specific) subunit beta [Euryarchaeota archaeon]|nr:NAD(P)(+) transhydrogenase (Re/Si-specific) subunit beta [Euryarchaeota archaeon]MDE2045796.1 NAD(P)(+) transhydrogenase (Re/Si-specific) subunit beta [Thermoplasmata archaeon]
MVDPVLLGYVKDGVYILATILFIYALHEMSNPATARKGILWAGAGMLLAILISGILPGISWQAFLTVNPGISTGQLEVNLSLMAVAVLLGGGLAYLWAIRVKMTDMPQMVAIYNGMGGGAAAGIAGLALIARTDTVGYLSLAVVGGLIGAVSFAGSLIAFLKLQGWMRQKPITFPGQQFVNVIVLLAAIVFGAVTLLNDSGHVGAIGTTVALPYFGINTALLLFFVLGLAYGFMMAVPIGGADMPVVISLFNAFTGIAVGLDGFATSNYAMIVAGMLVGSAGSLLTLLMAKAMNRSISNVLFSAFGSKEETGTEIKGSMKPMEVADAAALLAYAGKVIVAPGYGMAVAQAQHKVKEMMDVLEKKDVQVKFAIHPVAGRMPGHMNVLLAEAGVPYDHLFDRDEINQEFASADVVMVIGANDVVNPAARRQGSPLFGMPILDVDAAKHVLVLKRGQGKGFAGIENDLFYKDNTRMVYGDAQETVAKLVQELKKL